jgi:hypothetical protein
MLDLPSELHIYWSENSGPKSEASFVLTASSFNVRHRKERAEISYFDIDLKNNTGFMNWKLGLRYGPLEKNWN